MKLKVKYIGNDNHYWSDLQKRFIDLYPDKEFQFSQRTVDSTFDPIDEYLITYKEQVNIMYIDFTDEATKLVYFTKLYNRNNVTRLTSTVGLYLFPQQKNILHMSYLAGVRIHHYKTPERKDVVYDPMALLNTDLPVKPKFFRVNKTQHMNIFQQMRIGYMDSEKIHVETNCPLQMNELIKTNNHLLMDVAPSKRFLVTDFGDSGLYYGMRYWADLAHTYNGDQLFISRDYPYLDYMYFDDRRDEYEGDFHELQESLDSYHRKLRVGKEPVEHWVSVHQDGVRPKPLKVLAIDESMAVAEQLKSHGPVDYALNIQPHLTQDRYQIKRTYPHLICIQYDEDRNNEAEIEEIFKAIKRLPDYDPFFVIFGVEWEAQSLRDQYNYPHVMPFKENLDFDEINLLANRLILSLPPDIHGDRVYFSSDQMENVIEAIREVELVGLTESVIYLRASFVIPMYTVFKTDFPVPMMLTVVPHRENSSMAQPGVYRALINGISEQSKKELRRFINSKIEEES
jgi:hypothetical protein